VTSVGPWLLLAGLVLAVAYVTSVFLGWGPGW
jgi:hypothetical protein